MSTLVYRLVGYDKETESVSRMYDIPAKVTECVRRILGLNDAPDDISDLPLSERQAKEVGDAIEQSVDPSRMDFFLEAYEKADVNTGPSLPRKPSPQSAPILAPQRPR